MKKSLISNIISIFILFLVLPIVSADLGPKPTASIEASYNNQPILENFYASMLVCQGIDSNYGHYCDMVKKEANRSGGFESPLMFCQLNISDYDSTKNCFWQEDTMAWRGVCKNSVCEFGYSLPKDFKLAVYIPSLNKTFITNEITKPAFNSKYSIVLSTDGTAKIENRTPFYSYTFVKSYIFALIITLILELMVWLVFLAIKKLSKTILLYVIYANLISLTLLWIVSFALFDATLGFIILLIVGEILVWIFESWFIYHLSKNQISLLSSFIMSLIANLTSLFLGWFVLAFISWFIGF